MKKIHFLLALILITVSIGIIEIKHLPVVEHVEAIELPISELTHQQEVYISALEWCESQGVLNAINPNDSDNTPSYYSFQFKPGTFRYFGEKYHILPTFLSDDRILSEMTDYKTQRAIIEAMVLHSKEINWHQQFPDCSRKLGYPPLQELSTTTRTSK